jgi:hypothetical protein
LPLIKKIKEKNYTIGIWKITSSEYDSNLCEKIHPDYHSNFLNYKMEKRRWEVYGTKLLFNELISNNELTSKKGIPYIKDNEKHISITHTNDLVAMIIADYYCGIDIESQERDASKIKHKFLNIRDFKNGDDKKEILKTWCMKEVLYKVKKEQKIMFNTHLFIQKKSSDFFGICQHPKFSFSCSLKIVNFENYFLAFNTDYSQ